MTSPDHVDGPRADFRIAAHDGHAGGERAVDAEHDEFSATRQNRQIAVSRRVVTPVNGNKPLNLNS